MDSREVDEGSKMFESPLVARYKQLKARADPHGRGEAFEHLLVDAFREAHFRVVHDPEAAMPRQTDLVGTYGPDRYLIEAKWKQQPADINDIDGVYTRLGRTESSVIGVIFSVAGFGTTAVEEVGRNRKRSILLFGEPELLRVLGRPEELVRLLRNKREQLVVHARVHLEAAKPPKRGPARPLSDVPGTDVKLLDLDHQELPYLATGGEFGQFVYVQDLPDIDWVPASGHGVSLDMSFDPHTAEGIVDVLYELHRMGWVTERPRWSIQQSSMNWHGIGPQSFVTALREWESRTEEMPDAHHTEEVAYYDTCTGGYLSLTAGIAHHPSRVVYTADLSFQLVGVPLDANPILHLHEVFDISEPDYFRPRAERSVTRHRRHQADAMPLEPVGYLVTPQTIGGDEEDWVTGIVAKNPYRHGDKANPDGWPELVAQSELLVCDLRSHHPLDEPREGYLLFNWETTWTSNAMVVRVVADW
jgi:Restriction endonuclease